MPIPAHGHKTVHKTSNGKKQAAPTMAGRCSAQKDADRVRLSDEPGMRGITAMPPAGSVTLLRRPQAGSTGDGATPPCSMASPASRQMSSR